MLPSRGGVSLIDRLFAPLGYIVRVANRLLDAQYPGCGDSNAFTVKLEAVTPLKQLLAHLYVLILVLDNDKHYYVGEDEITKLMSRGEGWLAGHPERDLIVDRYLRHRHPLTLSALELLREEDVSSITEATEVDATEVGAADAKPLESERRLDTVLTRSTSMDTKGKRFCWAVRAELALYQGKPDQALSIIERLKTSAPGMMPGRVIPYLWKLRAEALAEIGQLQGAKTLLDEAIERVRRTGERFLL